MVRTYRDSWWDEAITMWYALSNDPALAPIEEYYRSDIVSGRSAVAVGFDRRAYDQGARIVQALAAEMGGRERMVASCATCTRGARSNRSRPGTSPTRSSRERPRPARAVPALALPVAERPGGRRPADQDWLHRVDLALPAGR